MGGGICQLDGQNLNFLLAEEFYLQKSIAVCTCARWDTDCPSNLSAKYFKSLSVKISSHQNFGQLAKISRLLHAVSSFQV